MASKYRALVAVRARQALLTRGGEAPSVRNLVQKMSLNLSKAAAFKDINTPTQQFSLHLPVSALGITSPDLCPSDLIESFESDAHLPSISITPDGQRLSFSLPRDRFIGQCLSDVLLRDPNGVQRDLRRMGVVPEEGKEDTVVVEFSSPNIAKPFHMGHLRSTLVGSFVANVHEAVGHKVERVNFLGDWGTQFGLLASGIKRKREEEGTYDLETELSTDAIAKLYSIYVSANAASASDPTFASDAQTLFHSLEQGDPEQMSQWRLIRECTRKELEKTYGRLGVRFDHFHGEAMYGLKDSEEVIQAIKAAGVCQTDERGRLEATLQVKGKEKKVTLIKSDGSTLYISRDIAAFVDRIRRFNFDKMLYVVENGQSDHFINLFALVEAMGHKRESEVSSHIKFGRIHGMSSRKGTAVFLKDILDEARDRMSEQRSLSDTTRRGADSQSEDDINDVLGTTAVIVNDLKQKRNKSYEFSWERALHAKGDSGIKLHYTHCRLHSLRESFGDGWETAMREVLSSSEVSSLHEPCALALVLHLAQFDEAVRDSYLTLESAVLVQYLFRLCNLSSKALKELHVKGEARPEARMALFMAAKEVLGQGMRILGVDPLQQM